MDRLKTAEINWNTEGLIPAVIQDYLTGQVLMVAYMDEEALQRTVETGETWFWSRSRKELWHKGSTSGNIQKVINVGLDCDRDTLLIEVEPRGPACHLGTDSCFNEDSSTFLDSLQRVIKERKQERPEGSYTAYLFERGLDKILKKVGEEAAEVIIAAKNPDPKELIRESADLLYHLLVLLEERQIAFRDVLGELKDRRNR
ncbi:MAG: bifunctional phosphoribosyl-AMP cyclohydrolase/phosphoribosyl-ATP diphosphatase HisIE [Clostridia bacterium]|nr:bifunctional phosphoribosyl-AMP cyclohydrolase/phosphoribosyl-ATP diphosphatase HisIE [Clostridia bacterium]